MPADSTEDQNGALLPLHNESLSTLDSCLYSNTNIPNIPPSGQVQGYNFERETHPQPQDLTITALPEVWLNLHEGSPSLQASSQTDTDIDDWLDPFQSPPEFEF